MTRALLAALLLAACSTPDTRYLTREDDQALRERCEQFDAVGGCAALPMPLFRHLIEQLRSCRKGQET